MENKVPDRLPPKPGIAEAIHPEIGNGASWETDQHHFLLRSPDPTKDLDKHFQDIETNLIITPDLGKTEELEIGSHPASSENDAVEVMMVIEAGKPAQPVDSSLQDDHFIPPVAGKGKEKTNRKKKIKTQDSDVEEGSALTNQEESIQELHKAPKAGKLVRKAAKSVRKQEEEEKKVIAQNLALTESTLSPYTQWLKGLKGSEYVHPYEDDFAFEQVNGPAKEGISETFAELLASQGYKEQAVEMYMKLMEKYPEKSGFFAAKIEALQ